MKDRFSLLAGLIDDEDEIDNIRYTVVESYIEQMEDDTKIFSENVNVLEEDEFRLGKMIGIEEEYKDPEFSDKSNILNENSVAMGGIGPGFASFDNRNQKIDNKDLIKTMEAVAMGGFGIGFSEQSIKTPEAPQYFDDETYEKGDLKEQTFEIIPDMIVELKKFSNLDTIKPILESNFVSVSNIVDAINELKFVSGNSNSPFYLDKDAERVIDVLSSIFQRNLNESTPGYSWIHRRTGTPDDSYVRFREDPYGKEPPTMNPSAPEQPNAGSPFHYTFYQNDPTYIKMQSKMEDPLDLKEYEEILEKYNKFVDKYNIGTE